MRADGGVDSEAGHLTFRDGVEVIVGAGYPNDTEFSPCSSCKYKVKLD